VTVKSFTLLQMISIYINQRILHFFSTKISSWTTVSAED